MFKKDISAGAKTKVKSSVQRGIRSKVVEQYPLLEPYLDTIIPKKEQLELVKLPDRVSLYALNNVPLFYQHMDDPLIPHLSLVHKYPACFKRVRIDRGAIRFVLSGASLMAPGLTSPGGRLPNAEAPKDNDEIIRYGSEDIPAGEVVVVEAEGKDNACLVGPLKLGTSDIKSKKKGVAMDQGHFLGDGLWKMSLA
ncbi:pua domain-containing protein [Neofusicoccum parvum]|uniref:Pua domain-containing protein n=1 Tax=Neofusicoccum parvum TaxID=310453 RepID=A0ACB5RZB8_9PEZI|nr:pua domain-containing protein [Neofusicoccum parvum]